MKRTLIAYVSLACLLLFSWVNGPEKGRVEENVLGEKKFPGEAYYGETPDQRRVDLDTAIAPMALTAKEMNTKYKETSEGGLAVSVVLC